MAPTPDPSSASSDARRFQEAMTYLASFTDYEQLLHRAPTRTTFDLGRLERLLDRFGAPHRGPQVAHVTGTKGKTSTTWMIDALLRRHGVRTFRFVSPHVERVHERLAVDGTDIADGAFADLVATVRPELERIERSTPADLPSFFEVMTVMGFLWARARAVDALVLEVGLGGRLDATNVVDPAVAVITSIGLDHTRILGSTREAIAAEKAGILKAGRPAILGLTPEDPAFAVVARRAADLGCPLVHPGCGLELRSCAFRLRDDGGPGLVFSGRVGDAAIEDFALRAGAAHQAGNALLALAATQVVLRAAGRELDPAPARAALAGLDFPGRAEWFPGPPAVLLDGAHTAESIRDLAEVAGRVADGRPLHLLCGLTRDRDPDRVFTPLLPRVASITATSLPTPRSRPPEDILAALPAGSPPARAEPDLARALRQVLDLAGSGGLVLVTGSLYLAGACRTLLRRPPIAGPRPAPDGPSPVEPRER